MDEKDEKPCRACGEPIRKAARKCPHCNSIQTLWKEVNNVFGILILIVFLAPLIFFIYRNFLTKKVNFSNPNSQQNLVIVDSKMFFSESDKGSHISVVGRIKNNTGITWKYLCFEAQFFNASGDLVDTVSERGFDLVLPPHSEASFRVRGEADKEKDQYVKHKIILLWAEEERDLF